MEKVFVYPGRFNPPTYGHLEIVKQTAKLFGQLSIICSSNPEKNDIFSTEESKELWNAYQLPPNVKIFSFNEFLAKKINPHKIIIVRGIRTYDDLKDENRVLELNHRNFGIDKYFYILSSCGYENISATRVRTATQNLAIENFSNLISPLVVSALLEKSLEQKSIWQVVGKPASGKSTFMKLLCGLRDDVIHINTDLFNQELKPLLKQYFGEEDLIKIALEREAELRNLVFKPWMSLLKESLRKAKKNSHVFIEVAYGLQGDKPLYKIMGGRVLYIGCENVGINVQRAIDRGTSHMIPFIDVIPDRKESRRIAKAHKLELREINSSGDIKNLEMEAKKFSLNLK